MSEQNMILQKSIGTFTPEDFLTRPDLTSPSLLGLAWVLRHQEELPLESNFFWDFGIILETSRCGSAGCAIGEHRLMWPDSQDPDSWMIDYLGYETGNLPGYEIFYRSPASPKDVTPAIVADRIEDFLCGRPIRYMVEGDHL